MVDGENDGAAPTGEDKQWADLAAEVEIELGDEGGDTPAEKPAPAEAEGEQEAEQKPTPVPYEELERRHKFQANALKQTREEAQAAKEQLRAFTQMVEDMRAQRKAPAAEQEAKPEPVPDRFEDPVGYFEHKIATLTQQLEATQKQSTETREQFQQRQEYQQFMGHVSQAEEAFAATTPDYHDAAKYLETGRRAELGILFPDSPQMDNHARQQGFQNAAAMREAVFVNDAQTVARNALMAGMNPAQAYYELAKGRGYRPAAAGQATQEKLDRANNVIDATRRGAKASKTISGGGGGPDNPLNIADLTDLYAEDPEEFDKQWEKMAKAGKLG